MIKIYDIECFDTTDGRNVANDVVMSEQLFRHVIENFLRDSDINVNDYILSNAINSGKMTNRTDVIFYDIYELHIRIIDCEKIVEKTDSRILYNLLLRSMQIFNYRMK